MLDMDKCSDCTCHGSYDYLIYMNYLRLTPHAPNLHSLHSSFSAHSSLPTAVLVHGAGHTAAVWDATRAAMAHDALAVDLPGRASRPGDITTVTVAEAADAVVADVVGELGGHVEAGIVLVGHSVAGTILPAVAARLAPHVRHLVFVAGITAPGIFSGIKSSGSGSGKASRWGSGKKLPYRARSRSPSSLLMGWCTVTK